MLEVLCSCFVARFSRFLCFVFYFTLCLRLKLYFPHEYWNILPECGADLWSDHGLITSPNYPYSYHSYRTCIWRITVPDDHYVIITFHEFDINKSYRPCFVDSVEIHDGYTEESPLLGNIFIE